MTKLSQRVVQDPQIQGRVILMPWALLPSRWAYGLVWLHGHIVAHPQISYRVVFGHIGCITPINLPSKFGPIPCPMDTLYGNWGKATTFETKKTKNKNNKPNARINVINESYFLHDEGIT
jgi:hypothetical protein